MTASTTTPAAPPVSEEAQYNEGVEDEDARIVRLASRAAAGDDEAFSELYGVFAQRIFNLVLRSVHDRPTAEDLCQEIWLKVHTEIRHLRAPEAVRSWLYRIASHACVDFARSSRGQHRNKEDSIDELVLAYGPQPEDAAIRGAEVRMVWETLGAMAPRQSIALYLKQIDGCSYGEIASILDCPVSTVETLLFRARQSFVRSYDKVQASPGERCHMFQQVMAGVIDNEPTRIQRSALEAHSQECKRCRSQLVATRRAINGYAALPLLPVGNGLVLPTILGGAAVATTTLLGPTTLAGLFSTAALKAKLLVIAALLAAGAAATTTIDIPGAPNILAAVQHEEGDQKQEDAPGAAGLSLQGNGQNGSQTAQVMDNSVGGAASHGPAGSTERGGQDEGPLDHRNSDDPTSSDGPSAPEGPGAPSAGDSGPSDGGETSGEPPDGTLDGLLDDPVGGLAGTTEELLGGVATVLDGTLDGAGAIVDDTLVMLGDTLEDTVLPVVTSVVEPVDTLVNDLTGLSVTQVLDTVLPDETESPVSDLLDSLTDPILNLLQPTPPPAQSTPSAEPTPKPCLLLILCP